MLETKGRFFPKGRTFLSGRKNQAVSNLRSGMRARRAFQGEGFALVIKGKDLFCCSIIQIFTSMELFSLRSGD